MEPERQNPAGSLDETLLRPILDAAPCPLVVIGADGVIEAASAAAARLFGYRSPDVVGWEIGRLIDARDGAAPGRGAAELASLEAAVAAAGEPARSPRAAEPAQRRVAGAGRVASGMRHNGTRFPIEVTVSEIPGDDAAQQEAGPPTPFAGRPGARPVQPRRAMVFIRDLTEQHATQARLRELQADLVHVSRLRAMGQMTAALAHELNQPLTATTNYLNAAARMIDQVEPDLARIRQAVSLAAQQTVRSGEIIRRLRAFVARGEVVRRPESIGRIVEEASALALVDAKDHGVTFAMEASPDLPLVLVDRVQIQQVLLNLVRNAVEAMDGMRERVMSVHAVLWDSVVAVSVSDTGAGISPGIEAQLFQPFVTTKRDGMGIGLSVCRTIVEAHGGRLWAEARPKGGTVFRFTVPLAPVGEDDAPSE